MTDLWPYRFRLADGTMLALHLPPAGELDPGDAARLKTWIDTLTKEEAES